MIIHIIYMDFYHFILWPHLALIYVISNIQGKMAKMLW